jgi:hypothetical protein
MCLFCVAASAFARATSSGRQFSANSIPKRLACRNLVGRRATVHQCEILLGPHNRVPRIFVLRTSVFGFRFGLPAIDPVKSPHVHLTRPFRSPPSARGRASTTLREQRLRFPCEYRGSDLSQFRPPERGCGGFPIIREAAGFFHLAREPEAAAETGRPPVPLATAK